MGRRTARTFPEKDGKWPPVPAAARGVSRLGEPAQIAASSRRIPPPFGGGKCRAESARKKPEKAGGRFNRRAPVEAVELLKSLMESPKVSPGRRQGNQANQQSAESARKKTGKTGNAGRENSAQSGLGGGVRAGDVERVILWGSRVPRGLVRSVVVCCGVSAVRGQDALTRQPQYRRANQRRQHPDRGAGGVFLCKPRGMSDLEDLLALAARETQLELSRCTPELLRSVEDLAAKLQPGGSLAEDPQFPDALNGLGHMITRLSGFLLDGFGERVASENPGAINLIANAALACFMARLREGEVHRGCPPN